MTTPDFAHWVQAGDLAAARRHGLTLLAACGLIWTPDGPLSEKLPCPECEALQGRIREARRDHFVYRCFDDAGNLLYVGCTWDPISRRTSHAQNSWWFSQVDSYRLTIYPTRARALKAESAAIATEHPLWNVRGQDFHKWPQEQILLAAGRAEQMEAPDAVRRRFTKLVRAA